MQRADILQAAAAIFSQKGYHAASMQDIADAVRLQKPSLYHHVESKQDILMAILDQTLELLIAEIAEIVDTHLDPGQKLLQAMMRYVDRLTEHADISAVLLLEHRSLEEDLRAQHIQKRDCYERYWRQIIQEGIDAGIFRDLDVVITTAGLLGVMNWLITWFRPDGRLSGNQLALQFYDLFLDGLLARDGK